MKRIVAALKWAALFAGVIAATCGYLWTCDRFGVGRAGRWALLTVMLITPIVLIALMVREDIRAEDARWGDDPDQTKKT